MAVGLLNRASSQSEISKGNMTKQRRNGMAYIFHGQSSEDISYLKECFTKRLESTSSEIEFETDSESDIEVDSFFDALRDVETMDVDTDTENSDLISTESESTESGYPVTQATRRLALADIFEGVPEEEVSEFLAKFSSVDTDDDDVICSGDDEHQHATRTRRFAKSNIFDGIPKDKLDEMLQKYHNIENDIDSCEVHSPNQNYIHHRRGALADIFHEIDDDLKAKLAERSAEDSCSSSDGSESQTESDESDVQMNGHNSDSSLPDESYLWRRRCALANIFEYAGSGSTESRFRAQ